MNYIIPRNNRLLQYGKKPKSSNPILRNGIIFYMDFIGIVKKTNF